MSRAKRERADSELSVGQLRRLVVLETEAVYRVCGLAPGLVDVEVVKAPGLTVGQQFAFTREAVLAMDLLDGDGDGDGDGQT